MPPQDERRHNELPSTTEKINEKVRSWVERWQTAYAHVLGERDDDYVVVDELIKRIAEKYIDGAGKQYTAHPAHFNSFVRFELHKINSDPERPAEKKIPILTDEALPPLVNSSEEPEKLPATHQSPNEFAPPQQQEEAFPAEVHSGSVEEEAHNTGVETASEVLSPEIVRMAEKIADELVASFPDMREDLKKEIREAAIRVARSFSRATDQSEATFRRILQFDPEWIQLEREAAREREATSSSAAPTPPPSPKQSDHPPVKIKGFGGLAGFQFPPASTAPGGEDEKPSAAQDGSDAPPRPASNDSPVQEEVEAKNVPEVKVVDVIERIDASIGDEVTLAGIADVKDGDYRLADMDDTTVTLRRVEQGVETNETIMLGKEEFKRMFSEPAGTPETQPAEVPARKEMPEPLEVARAGEGVSTNNPSATLPPEAASLVPPPETSPAVNEPPPSIEGNGEPVEPGKKQEGVYAKEDEVAAARAEKAKIINERGEEFRRKTLELRILEHEIAKRKLTDKEFARLRALRPEREALVKELNMLVKDMLGEDAVKDAVKWVDPEHLRAYAEAVKGLKDDERKKRIAQLPREVLAAKELERKTMRRFEGALKQKGISEDTARMLYREYVDRAIQLCRFADYLNANDAKALEKLSKKNVHIEHLLDFHGITERDPEKLKDALRPIVEQYRRSEVREKKKKAPTLFLRRVEEFFAQGGALKDIPLITIKKVLETGNDKEKAWADEALRELGLSRDELEKTVEQERKELQRESRHSAQEKTAEKTPPWPWPTSGTPEEHKEHIAVDASVPSVPQEISGSDVRNYLFGREMDDMRSELREQGAQFSKTMAKNAGAFLRTNDELSAWENAPVAPPVEKPEEKKETQLPPQETEQPPAVETGEKAHAAIDRLPRQLRDRVEEVERALLEHPETVPDAIIAEFAKAGFPWAKESLTRRGTSSRPPSSPVPQKPAKGNGQTLPIDSGLAAMEEKAYLKRREEEKKTSRTTPSFADSMIPAKEQEQETAFAKAMHEVREGKRVLALEPMEDGVSPTASLAEAMPHGITEEARRLLQRVDEGGVPMMITQNFKRILEANGISYRPDMTPNEAIELLRAKEHQATATLQEATPTKDEEQKNRDTATNRELDATGEQWAHFIEVNYGDKSLAEARTELRNEEAVRRRVDEAAAAGNVAAVVAAEANAGTDAEAPKMLTPDILNRYEEEFRVPKESLAAIPEFVALTEGQRLLVLRDLNRTMISRIRTRALKDYREKFEALGGLTDGEKKFLAEGKTMTGKWWRRFAVGMLQIGKKLFWKKIGMSLVKEKLIADKENEIKTALREKKLDHTELIRELSRNAKFGPEAEMKDGKLALKFVKESDFGGPLAPEEAERVAAFNKAAQAWMDMPHTFTEPDAREQDRAAYEEAKKTYTRALYDILELKRLKVGEQRSAIDVLDLDRRITLSQFFNTHPGEAERFAELKNTNAWWRWIRSTALLRTKAFAMGAAVRTVAAGTIASVAAPVAAIAAAPVAGAVVGRSMGRRRAEIELEEREEMAKMGVRDSSIEAKNIVDVEKLAQKIERIKSAIADIPADTKDPALKEKRDDLIRSLEARYWYTREKIEKGLINFGDSEAEAHRNRFALARALGTAIGVAEVEQKWDNEIKRRLRRFVDYKERVIKTREGAFIDERGKMAATYGAVAAGAGAVIADILASNMTGRGVAAELIGTDKKGNIAAPDAAAPSKTPSTPEQEPYPFAGSTPETPKSAPSAPVAPLPPTETLPVPPLPQTTAEVLTFDRLPADAQEHVAAQFFLLGRTPTIAERDALAFLSYMRDMKGEHAAETLRYDDTYRALVRAMELREGVPLPDAEVRRILEEAGVGERMRQYLPELWGMRPSDVAAEARGAEERLFPVQTFTAEAIRKNIAEMHELLSGVRAPSAPETALYARLKFLGEHPPEGLAPRDVAGALERFKELLHAKGKGELTEAELEDFLRREKLERHVPFEYLKPLFGKPLPR